MGTLVGSQLMTSPGTAVWGLQLAPEVRGTVSGTQPSAPDAASRWMKSEQTWARGQPGGLRGLPACLSGREVASALAVRVLRVVRQQ